MNLNLSGKRALVLSSSKGIGRGVAAALLTEGARVIIASSDAANLSAAQAELRKTTGAEPTTRLIDLREPAQVASAVDAVIQAEGGVDILVTNGPGPKPTASTEIAPEALSQAFNVNLHSVIVACSKVLPGMIQRKHGRLIHLTSTTGKEPDSGMVLSNVFRAAVLAYSKTLSREVAIHGVTSNAILTGGVLTERLDQLIRIDAEASGKSVTELMSQAKQSFPVGFIATPAQFAPLVAFLASELSCFVNGANIPLDGGIMRGL